MASLWFMLLLLTACGQAVSMRSGPSDMSDEVCAYRDEVSLLQQWSAVKSRADQGAQLEEIYNTATAFEGVYSVETAVGSSGPRIKGFRPHADGAFPVFVYLPGTLDEFATPQDLELVKFMAHKGFLAATVEYENNDFCFDVCQSASDECKDSFFGSKVPLRKKALKIKKALDSICSKNLADCHKGVALMGHGQGGFLAMLLTLLDRRVTAILPMGVGPLAERALGFSKWKKHNKCILDDDLSKHLPRSKRRYINGEEEDFSDGDMVSDNKGLQAYSGYKCHAWRVPVNCFQQDGSGYHIVAESEYDKKSGSADNKVAPHNFFGSRNPVNRNSKLLPAFHNGTAPWCMKPSLSWLAKAAQDPTRIDFAEYLKTAPPAVGVSAH